MYCPPRRRAHSVYFPKYYAPYAPYLIDPVGHVRIEEDDVEPTRLGPFRHGHADPSEPEETQALTAHAFGSLCRGGDGVGPADGRALGNLLEQVKGAAVEAEDEAERRVSDLLRALRCK